MVRGVIAVYLACLFTVGGVLAVARASAATGSECPKPVRRSGDGRPLQAADPPRTLGRAHAHAHRLARLGTLTRAVEPRRPGPGETAQMSADLQRRLAARYGTGAPPGPAQQEIRVPLWVHIIKDRGLGAPDSAVAWQVETLNAAYGGKFGGVDTRVRFELKGITHTVDRAWFRDPLGNEKAVKAKLRVGGPETLNLFVAQLGELVLGYATYPYWYQGAPGLDGVVIDWRSLPGGPLRNFNQGFTAVHEIGHWLGLLHTFENGCEAPGDSVDDTPPEAYATMGCPARKHTCPGSAKDDPIHNFMDYSHDRCMREFTAGQAARIRQMWDIYRNPDRAK